MWGVWMEHFRLASLRVVVGMESLVYLAVVGMEYLVYLAVVGMEVLLFVQEEEEEVGNHVRKEFVP